MSCNKGASSDIDDDKANEGYAYADEDGADEDNTADDDNVFVLR
jgi:hypothetical protein